MANNFSYNTGRYFTPTMSNFIGGTQSKINTNPILNPEVTKPNPAQLNPPPIKSPIVNKPPKVQPPREPTAQEQYLESLRNPPSSVDIYNQYAESTGLNQSQKLLTDIDNTISDLEGKIMKIEPDITARTAGFLVPEAARRRLITAEETPLRTQYADILRSRGKIAGEVSAKAGLVSTMLGLSKEQYGQKTDYLKALMDIEEKRKAGSDATFFTDLLKDKLKLEQPVQEEQAIQEPDLTPEEIGTSFLKKPISKKGLSGNVIYTTPTGLNVKWSPISNKWIKSNTDYEKKLNNIGL